MEKIRHIRITTSNKLPDRFLTSQVRDIAQDDNKTDKLFFVIEINAPWFSSAQIGQAVINAISREYSRSVSTSILENFETSLKKANEALSRAAENGETNWIGNINAVIALVSENQIHFTYTGSNFMHLIRDAKINPVAENIESNLAASPLQTFSNIVSGELKTGDKIIIANGAFFYKIPKEEILESFENDSIFIIAKNIVRKLQTNKIKAGSAVMLESITENSPDFNASMNDVVYLDQPITDFLQNGRDFFKKYVKPRWQKTLHFVSRSSKEGYRLFRKHVVPGTKNIFQKTVKITKEQTEKAQKLGSKALQDGLEKSRPFLKKANEQIQDSLAKIKKTEPEENIVGKTIYTVNYYQDKKKDKNSESFWQKFEGVREITSHWYEKALEFFKKNRRLVYIIAAILFILILTFSVANRGGKKTQEIQTTKALTALEEAKQKRDEAKMSVLFNDKEKSKTLYQEIINLAEIALSSEELKNEASQIKKDAQGELDKLIFATRFENLQPLVDFGEIANIFSVTVDDIYSAGQSGQINAYNFATKEINKISILPPGIQAVSGKYSLNSVFILTNEPNFLGLGLNDKVLSAQNLKEGSWEKPIDFAIFNDTAYFLDADSGQIWKHAKEGGIWQKGAAYLDPEKVDIKKSLGIAIDGAIFVLKSEGSVIKLSRGEKQDFALRNIPTPRNKIAKPLEIFTDENTTSIYILEGPEGNNPARVMEFKKDGEFAKQYLLPPDLKNIKSFEISQKDRKAWVLDSGRVYQIEL